MNKSRILSRLAVPLLCTAAFCQQAVAQAPAPASAVSDGVVKLGVLTDLSGPFSDFAGNGSIAAVRMAVADFGGKVLGRPVEVVYADHQNKTDVGANIAREWYDTSKVDAIFDISNSGVALAVMNVTRDKNKVVVLGGVSTTRVTTDSCTPNSIQYVYDANALSNVVGKALLSQGADSWYFITVDFAFGHGLEKTTADVVKASGGTVVGAVRHPLNTTDFSSYLLRAQSSGAKVIALANSGTDTTNAIKGASEFGLGTSGKQRVASLLTFISDVHAMGLPQAQGIQLTEAFYWDANEESRKWARRFFEANKRMPTMVHAGMYSAAMHYLKSIQSAGGDGATAVMAKMKSTPVNDFFARNGTIRADGLHVHDMYLMDVKKPADSKYPWDYYNIKATVKAEQAFSPMVAGACASAR
ncbi:ABC transporter substrate-binding protein [Variovorax sp. VNK109]|uniref:ABC transporter substrate-binding protein n=1 Tax=Variovorax sp. VNK109 TaxID=3400919 RepID=UPI003BFCC5AC